MTLKDDPILLNSQGLKSTLDKVKWGIPFKSPPSIWERVAILYRDIISEHFFADGNKRIAFISSLLFLNKNGYFFETTNDDVFETTMEVAKGNIEFNEVKEWFKSNSKRV